jgi:hypothetical protein
MEAGESAEKRKRHKRVDRGPREEGQERSGGGATGNLKFSTDWKIFFQWLENFADFFQ